MKMPFKQLSLRKQDAAPDAGEDPEAG